MKRSYRPGVVILIHFFLFCSGHVSCGEASDKPMSISLTPSHTELLPVENVKSFFTVGDKIVITSGTASKWSNEVSVFNFNGIKKLWGRQGIWLAYPSNAGSEADLVLVESTGNERWGSKVYGLTGDLVFRLDSHKGFLHSTPDSRYYYSGFDRLNDNLFRVYSRDGQELSSDLPKSYSWWATAFNDKVIAYFQANSIEFLELPSLAAIGQLDVESRAPLYSDFVSAVTSPQGDHMFVTWLDESFFVGPSMDISWSLDHNLRVLDCGFSETGEYLAILCEENDISYLRLFRSRTGEVLASYAFEYPIRSMGGHYIMMFSETDIAFVLSTYESILGYNKSGLIQTDTVSSVFVMDSDKAQIVHWLTERGSVQVFVDADNVLTLTLVEDVNKRIRMDKYEVLH